MKAKGLPKTYHTIHKGYFAVWRKMKKWEGNRPVILEARLQFFFRTGTEIIGFVLIFFHFKPDPIKCPFCGKETYHVFTPRGVHCTNCDPPKPTLESYHEIEPEDGYYKKAYELAGYYFILRSGYATNSQIKEIADQICLDITQEDKEKIAYEEIFNNWYPHPR